MDKEDLLRTGPALDAFLREFDECAIAPTRKLIAAYVRGQLGSLPRKSVMPIARDAGIAPRTLQEMLSLHRWNEELMRSILRERIRRTFTAARTVSVIHESACLKKGDMTPGVDRQFSMATGKVVNCCVILHLAISQGDVRAVVESELFLPPKWAENRSLRKSAKIPDGVGFVPRSELALGLVDRMLAGRVPLGTLLLDSSLGGEFSLLRDLGDRGIRYLAALPPQARGWTTPPRSRPEKPRSLDQLTARESLPFQPVSRAGRAGPSEGFPVGSTTFYPEIEGVPGGLHQLLMLRHPWTNEPRYVVTNAPASTGIPSLVETAFLRRPLEEALKRDLATIGFDHFEVRSYQSLRRHLTLSAATLLFLAESRWQSAQKSREEIDPSRLAAL